MGSPWVNQIRLARMGYAHAGLPWGYQEQFSSCGFLMGSPWVDQVLLARNRASMGTWAK